MIKERIGMKSKFLKRIAMIAIALTVCVVGFAAQNTSYAAKLGQTKKLAVQVEDNQVQLTWNKVSGAKKYQVYRAASPNGKYKLVKTTTSNKWTDANRKGECWYKVRAINGKKTGAYSAKNHVFRINAKITGFSKGAFQVKVTNLSATKPIYFLPVEGFARAVVYNQVKVPDSPKQYDASLSPAKVVTVPKKGSKTISIAVPGLSSFHPQTDGAAVVATFTTSKTIAKVKYAYVMAAFYDASLTQIEVVK